jgi:hypothetical protein
VGRTTLFTPVDINLEQVVDFLNFYPCRLEIVAQDKSTTPLKSSPLIVDIEVLDANDNSPQFTKDSYTRGISETSSVGSFVEEVQALDADIGVNGQVVYSLLNGTEYFKIENETGMFLNIVCIAFMQTRFVFI